MMSKRCNRCQISVTGLELPQRATTASERHHFSSEDAFKCCSGNVAQRLLGDVTMRLHHYKFGQMFPSQTRFEAAQTERFTHIFALHLHHRCE